MAYYATPDELLRQWHAEVGRLRLAVAQDANDEQLRRVALAEASKQLAIFAVQAGEDWMQREGLNLQQRQEEVKRLKLEAENVARRVVVEISRLNQRLAAELSRVRELAQPLRTHQRLLSRAAGSSSAGRQTEREKLEMQIPMTRHEIGNALAAHLYEVDRVLGYTALETTLNQAVLGHIDYTAPPPTYEDANAPPQASSPSRSTSRHQDRRRTAYYEVPPDLRPFSSHGGNGRPNTIYADVPLDLWPSSRPTSSHSRRGSLHGRSALPPLDDPSAEVEDRRSGGASGRPGSSRSTRSTRYQPGIHESPPHGDPRRRSWVPQTPISANDLVSPTERDALRDPHFSFDSFEGPSLDELHALHNWDPVENEPTQPTPAQSVHHPGPRPPLRVDTSGHGRPLHPHEQHPHEQHGRHGPH